MYTLKRSRPSFLLSRVRFPRPSFSRCSMMSKANISMALEAAAIFFETPVRYSVMGQRGLRMVRGDEYGGGSDGEKMKSYFEKRAFITS